MSSRHSNTRTFLGILMVLIVSGDDKTINGILEDSILLPCNCSERNLDMNVKWQTEGSNKAVVFKHNRSTSNFYGRFEGRAKVFLSENSNNCSVLLNNVTAEDKGNYICIFRQFETYQRLRVNLTVSAPFEICQTDPPNGSVQVFHCDVKGRYRDAEIQWSLDGQLLTNSTTTNITHKRTLDALTGFYHFNSILITKLNSVLQPTCDVKAKNISTIISSDCRMTPEQYQGANFMRYRISKIIPIMLVLGLSLLLWSRCDVSKRIREVKTDNF